MFCAGPPHLAITSVKWKILLWQINCLPIYKVHLWVTEWHSACHDYRLFIFKIQQLGFWVTSENGLFVRATCNSGAAREYFGRLSYDGQVAGILYYYSVCCLTTGSKPLPKRFLHTVRSKASSFKREYPLLSLRSSNSFLRLLPRLLVTSISPFIFPSITCFRRQFLRKMWPIQLAFRLRISRRIVSFQKQRSHTPYKQLKYNYFFLTEFLPIISSM